MNGPKLEDDEILAWNFYGRNANGFVRDFGLMDSRLAELGIQGVANKDIFFDRLAAIHNTVMQKQADLAKAESGKEPASVTITGSENG